MTGIEQFFDWLEHTGLSLWVRGDSMLAFPTILTIHNAQYQGQTGMDKTTYLPEWDLWKRGLLEWAGALNPLAAGINWHVPCACTDL